MGNQNLADNVQWTADGVPRSSLFDDPYYSLQGGLQETRHVFLAGNNLPDRFRDGLHIAELGFGTGLNLIATALAWQSSGCSGRLQFTSFEAYPMPAADMAHAHSAFSGIDTLSAEIVSNWQLGQRHFSIGNIHVEVITGDAAVTLPLWPGRADAWFLDGFSPAKNPVLWSPDLLAQVARRTAPGGTFATYTAAGHVRRALQTAGFQVSRVPGFGTKRHMTRGTLPP